MNGDTDGRYEFARGVGGVIGNVMRCNNVIVLSKNANGEPHANTYCVMERNHPGPCQDSKPETSKRCQSVSPNGTSCGQPAGHPWRHGNGYQSWEDKK